MLPAGMLGADSVNPGGSWEPRRAVRLNEAIPQRHRSALTSRHCREEGVFDAKERVACIGEIGAFLTRLPAAPLVVIKESKITSLQGELPRPLRRNTRAASAGGRRYMPRVFVEYANLLNNWRREIKRISTALTIDLTTRERAQSRITTSRCLRCRCIICRLHWPPECSPKGRGSKQAVNHRPPRVAEVVGRDGLYLGPLYRPAKHPPSDFGLGR
jgi:hypothetical protein